MVLSGSGTTPLCASCSGSAAGTELQKSTAINAAAKAGPRNLTMPIAPPCVLKQFYVCQIPCRIAPSVPLWDGSLDLQPFPGTCWMLDTEGHWSRIVKESNLVVGFRACTVLVSACRGRARITRRRWRRVTRGGRTEPLCQHGFERIGPDLVALDGEMELVGVCHAPVEATAGIGQRIVDVEITDTTSVGKLGQPGIDGIDDRHHAHIVVARGDPHQHDARTRGLLAANIENRMNAGDDIDRGRVIPFERPRMAEVVGTRHEHDDLRIDAIELAVPQAPENVLCRVPA